MESLKNLKKSTRFKYKTGQMVYAADTQIFGIVCYRITRAYAIKEYYIKWIGCDKSSNYYLERELDYWVKEYDKVISDV